MRDKVKASLGIIYCFTFPLIVIWYLDSIGILNPDGLGFLWAWLVFGLICLPVVIWYWRSKITNEDLEDV